MFDAATVGVRPAEPGGIDREPRGHHSDRDMAAVLDFQAWFNSLRSRADLPGASRFIADDVELCWLDSALGVERGIECVRELLANSTPEHHLSLHAVERCDGSLLGHFQPATFGGETELHVVADGGRVTRIVVVISPERGWATRLARGRVPRSAVEGAGLPPENGRR
ncbi:hypothetical protein [Streptomyces sp. CA-132043]|uniref:hypothetical protein n=1 Tax=Streptomyces sp. CA-132043 TaxID=3240048 RepID=UPI003D94B8BD